MRIQVIHVSIPGTHKYLRGALERIVTFTYDGDANVDVLFATLAAAFFQRSPQAIIWIGLDEADKIVAHGYAGIEEYYGNRTIMCHQFWKNAGQEFAPGQVEGVLDSIKKWGRDIGITEMRTIAVNEQVARIAEHYGWSRMPRITMTMSTNDGSGEE
jgi:hypothetical protein